MLTGQQLNELPGMPMKATSGDTLGTVGEIYLDDTTELADFATVSTGKVFRKQKVVPLAAATLTGEALIVPYDKDTIKKAPALDIETGRISAADEAELRRHYAGSNRAASASSEAARTPCPPPQCGFQAVDTVVAGFARSRPAERVAFGMTVSFAATIAGARAITYGQERRRTAPKLRGLGRLFAQLPHSNDLRIHHSLPGMILAFTAGGISLVTGSSRTEELLSVPFGIGVALTTDELRLLAGRNNPYWGGKGFALAQGLFAAVPLTAMCALLIRRGMTESRTSQR